MSNAADGRERGAACGVGDEDLQEDDAERVGVDEGARRLDAAADRQHGGKGIDAEGQTARQERPVNGEKEATRTLEST